MKELDFDAIILKQYYTKFSFIFIIYSSQKSLSVTQTFNLKNSILISMYKTSELTLVHLSSFTSFPQI